MKNMKKVILPIVCSLAAPLFAACEPAVFHPEEVCDVILVNAPEEDIVVGDVVNLDDYVQAVYASGNEEYYNIYDVTVADASKDVVSLEGHTITALKEGDIKLDLVAGWTEETRCEGRVDWKVLSQLKSDWKGRIGDLTDTYGLVTDDYLVDEQENPVDYKSIHTAQYTYFDSWELELGVDIDSVPEGHETRTSSGKTYVSFACGGFIMFNSGVGYQWVADDAEGTNLLVLSAPVANYEYYFCNMPWDLSWDKCSTITRSGKEVLVYKSTEAGNYPDYFDNLTQEFVYISAQLYTTFTKMDVYKNEQGKFVLNPYYKNGTTTYNDLEFTLLDQDQCKVQFLEDAIANDLEPEPLEFGEIGTFADSLVTAGSYTYQATYGWFNAAGQETECPATLVTYGWDKALYNGASTGYVNATTQYAVDTDGAIDVFYEEGGKLLYATNVDEQGAITQTLTSQDTGGTTLAAAGLTPAAFGSNAAFWNTFIASSRVESAQGIAFTYAGGYGAAFNAAFLKSFIPGRLFYQFLANAYQDGAGLSYADGSITVAEGAMVVSVEFGWDSNTSYIVTIAISGLGTDAVPEFTATPAAA